MEVYRVPSKVHGAMFRLQSTLVLFLCIHTLVKVTEMFARNLYPSTHLCIAYVEDGT